MITDFFGGVSSIELTSQSYPLVFSNKKQKVFMKTKQEEKKNNNANDPFVSYKMSPTSGFSFLFSFGFIVFIGMTVYISLVL